MAPNPVSFSRPSLVGTGEITTSTGFKKTGIDHDRSQKRPGNADSPGLMIHEIPVAMPTFEDLSGLSVSALVEITGPNLLAP
jgi:hypothetical protein